MIEIQFPDSGLSAEYGDIIIGEVTGQATLTVSIGDETILTESYSPDADAKITIQDIGKLAQLNILRADFSTANGVDAETVVLSMEIVNGVDTITKDVTIYESKVNFAGSLDVELLTAIPLTRMTKKLTGTGRVEFVSFWGAGTVTAYVVKKGTTQDVAATYTVGTMADAGKMYRWNVSPDVIATMAGCLVDDLIYWNVYKDADCILRFTMDQRSLPVIRTFVFRNCFGAQETFTCTGDEESNRKWTREFGTSRNEQVSVSRTMINSIKVNTGFVTLQQIEALEDLMDTDQLALLDEQGYQSIVITDENFSNNSRRDEAHSFDFTYRFTANNQFRTTYAAFKKPRIFTPEFDQTFN